MITETLQAKAIPEKIEELREFLQDLKVSAAGLKGFIAFEIRETARPKNGFIIENTWEDEAALASFQNHSGYRDFFSNGRGFLSSAPMRIQSEMESMGLDGCGG